ncbi:hypothetical protein B0H19DRAFT_1183802 [Mycena capillaripes]|nr:hypothetical protein B0H19DRAFT_1183802 [Mycena capillaripes]
MPPSRLQVCREPRFPPELERAIFEIAASARPTSIPNLMVVAWRVNHWVEPLLYRVVLLCPTLRGQILDFPVITAEILLRVIAQKPANFLGGSVRHLCIDYAYSASPSRGLTGILTACTGVTNLFAHFVASSHVPALDSLRCVRRLAIDLKALLQPTPIDLTTSLFRTVTHLELLDLADIEEGHRIGARLALVPYLTHIAIDSTLHHIVSHVELCEDTRLQCIVFLGSHRAVMNNRSPLVDDPRFVFFCQSVDYRWGWLRGVDDAEDYWARADAFIAERRRREVDRGSLGERFRISDLDDEWRN